MPEQPHHCLVAILPCNDLDASTEFYGRFGFRFKAIMVATAF
jgi:predicted lactoylglutathione lyase